VGLGAVLAVGARPGGGVVRGLREVASLRHPGVIVDCAWSPDGRLVAISSDTPFSVAGRAIAIWDVAAQRPVGAIPRANMDIHQ
jgi:WD40 repeat protein